MFYDLEPVPCKFIIVELLSGEWKVYYSVWILIHNLNDIFFFFLLQDLLLHIIAVIATYAIVIYANKTHYQLSL